MNFLRFLTPLLIVATSLSVQAEDPSKFAVGSFEFTRPADWKWIPVSSPMRKAQLAIEGKEGVAPAEVTFFVFSGGAGGVQANVDRWFKQFQGDPANQKQEKKEIAGTGVTFVSTEGTFASGMPGAASTPMANFRLLGAILEAGDELVFVKATGPAALLKENEAKFAEFVAAAAQSKK